MVWLCALCGELNQDWEDECPNCHASKEVSEAEEQHMDEEDEGES